MADINLSTPPRSIEKALLAENNFTLLRLIAAIAVLYYHSYPLSLGKGAGQDPISAFLHSVWGMGLGGFAVGAFFVISGFLVTASFIHRRDVFAYAEARALRIFPGLFVAIIFSTFLLGATLTIAPLSDYLSDGRTWRYVYQNAYLLGGVQYDLPGLFKTNPWQSGVNGSLWTLPVELTMYIWVALLGIIGVLGHKAIFNLFAVMICLFASQFPDAPLIGVDGSQMNPLFFLLGAFFYVNRESISLNIPALLILGFLVLLTHNSQLFAVSKAILFAYLILFVALNRKINTLWLDRMGDISYGVYIYAFPIQQATALLIPGVEPRMMFLVSLPITLILAALSWRFVEKPCLALKGKIPMGRKFLDPRVNA